MRQSIKEILKNRILILDGAMGTMVQRYNLKEEDFRGEQFKSHKKDLKGNNDLLSITKPEIIKQIHKEYLEAGADIIETNTFSATSIAQADYFLEKSVYDINYQSAKIAKEISIKYSTSTKPRFVAGSIGPTNRTASISPNIEDPGFRLINFDQLKEGIRKFPAMSNEEFDNTNPRWEASKTMMDLSFENWSKSGRITPYSLKQNLSNSLKEKN